MKYFLKQSELGDPKIYCIDVGYLLAENLKREARGVFTDEDDDTTCTSTLVKDDKSGLGPIKAKAGIVDHVKDKAFKPDEVLHESAVGKGLAGALKFLQDRGTLNEGGEKHSDKKKSKPVGFKDGPKEIHIDRTDEFGRVVSTETEALSMINRTDI